METRGTIHRNATNVVQALMLVACGAACFAFFQTQLPFHFFYEEQNQLFLLTADYIAGYFGKPAWLACVVGDFLTQYYYYIYAGAAILTVCILVMGVMVWCGMKRVFASADISGNKAKWVAFGVGMLSMIVVAAWSMSEAYRLSRIIALIGGGLAQSLPRPLQRRGDGTRRAESGELRAESLELRAESLELRGGGQGFQGVRDISVQLLYLVVVSVLVYWMFGCGWLVFFFFEAARVLALLIRKRCGRVTAGLCVAASLLPVYAFVCLSATRLYHLNMDDALLYPGVGKMVSYDEAMRAERVYAYDNIYYYGGYNTVIEMYETEKAEPTEEMSFFYCLSLEQMGRLAEKLPTLKNPNLGTFLKIDEKTPLFQIKMINELYYLLGDMTYTERAALLANTFSPNCRNVRMVKRLAEANLVSGDTLAAMKYLRLLSKTMVYRQWAKNHTPGSMSPAVKAEIERKRKYVNTTDNIRLGDDCYVILTQLLDSNSENHVALDYLLASDMLSHQREVFIRDYEKYGPSDRPIFQQVYETASPDPSKGGGRGR